MGKKRFTMELKTVKTRYGVTEKSVKKSPDLSPNRLEMRFFKNYKNPE